MNKTIYIKDSDNPDWERAKQLARANGQSLSEYLMWAVRQLNAQWRPVADRD